MNKKLFNDGFDAIVTSLSYKFSTEAEAQMKRKVYFQFLLKKGFSDNDLKIAVNSILSNFNGDFGRKFPTTSDFLSSAGVLPTQVAKKALRWLKIQKIKIGPYRPLEVKNNSDRKSLLIIKTLQDLGGWVNYCNLMYDQEKKFDQEFLELYEKNYYDEKCLPEKHYLLGMSDLKNQELVNNVKLLACQKKLESNHGDI